MGRKENDNIFEDTASEAYKVSLISIVVNFLLSVFKFVAGIFANSGAMLSDAVHSLSDVLSTIVVMVGIKISQKQPDKEHPYGHERMESVASIILAMFLGLTGVAIGYSGLTKIIDGNYDKLEVPGLMALVAAVVSVLTKEWMFWYTKAAAKRLNMTSLMADAWHHRSDSLSSIGAFVGILGARLGAPVLDPIASVVICLFIVKAALDIFRDSLNKMVDHSCSEEIQNEIIELVLNHKEVGCIDMLKTREFGSKMYVDLEILVDGNLTLYEAHRIAEEVHDDIEEHFRECKHCMVHVNPTED